MSRKDVLLRRTNIKKEINSSLIKGHGYKPLKPVRGSSSHPEDERRGHPHLTGKMVKKTFTAKLTSVSTSLFQYKVFISSIGAMMNYNFSILDFALEPRPKIISKVRVFKFQFGYYSQLILNFELN